MFALCDDNVEANMWRKFGKSKEESAPSREPKSRAGAFKANLMKGEEPHEAALTNRTVESYGAQDLVSLRGAESSLPVPKVHKSNEAESEWRDYSLYLPLSIPLISSLPTSSCFIRAAL